MEKDNPNLSGPAQEHHKDTTDPQESEIRGNILKPLADKAIQPDPEDKEYDKDAPQQLPLQSEKEKENSPG